ncbi:MAG: hypothetical protein WCG47_33075, partial [Dermatophilaceae bacterium]
SDAGSNPSDVRHSHAGESLTSNQPSTPPDHTGSRWSPTPWPQPGIGDGNYQLGTLRVHVLLGQARLTTPDRTAAALAGSALTMATAVANATQLGLSIPDIAQSPQPPPHHAYGLNDIGTISTGQRANLCVLDDPGRLHAPCATGTGSDPTQ